tara:strand:- start:40475 stop:40870 length:396 start_codon:yes stop_codon:yes gene_type:complete
VTFVDQEFLNDPTTGLVGDCWRSAIASVLGVPRDAVPHFVRDYGDDWMRATLDWLQTNEQPTLRYTEDYTFPIGRSASPYVMMAGKSPRGHPHAVVADARTGEVVHDPHPSREGLSKTWGVFYFADREGGF